MKNKNAKLLLSYLLKYRIITIGAFDSLPREAQRELLLNKYIQPKEGYIYLTEKGRIKALENPTRFDAPKKPRKEKWYAILAFNGTMLLNRTVTSFSTKSRASNYAKDLIGKLVKARLVTSVVLDGPYKTMLQASTSEVVVPTISA
jgi:hypothetical protein